MSEFWSCGPFKEAVDNHKQMIFRIEQQTHLMSILEDIKSLEKLLKVSENETTIELAKAALVDAENRLNVLLGVPDA